MEDRNTTKIVLLNGKNYQNWKFKVELLLGKEGVWDVVNAEIPAAKTTEWLAKDSKAKGIIGLLVEDSLIVTIKKMRHAREYWMTLKDSYEKPSLSNQVYLLKRLCRMQLGNQAMDTHISQMLSLVDELQAIGEELKEQLVVAMILGSLPDEYDSLVTALETRPTAELTIISVKERLIQEYQRRNEFIIEENHAMKTRDFRETSRKHQSVPSEKASTSKEKQNIKCFGCGGRGHYRSDCQKKKQQKANIIHKCLQVSKLKQGWFIDSGATNHMSNDRHNFDNLKTVAEDNIIVADGRCLETRGVGKVTFSCKSGKYGSHRFHFNDVSFVPDLDSNLLSVNKLTEGGYDVLFSKRNCDISKNGSILLRIPARNGLYEIRPMNLAKIASIQKETCQSDCIHVWHRRLGHRNIEALKEMVLQNTVEGMVIKGSCKCNDNVCEVCSKGKMSRKKFPNESFSTTMGVLELVHSDIMGPMEEMSPSGNRYVLTIIDDYSRYSTIYFLQQKSQAFSKIKEFIAMVENQFNKRLKTFRSDGGGEFSSNLLKQFFRAKGIIHQTSVPYTPQQNGIAERKNRYLMEMCRCNLLESNLPKKFWAEAMNAANYTQNRLITKSLKNKCPFELWYGRKPNLRNFKVFGCIAYIHIPKQLRKKLDAKSKQVRFVGYCETSKGYRFLDVEKAQIINNRDAVFEENDIKKVTSEIRTTTEKAVTVNLTSDEESLQILGEGTSQENMTIELDNAEFRGSVDEFEDESDDIYSSAEEELFEPLSPQFAQEQSNDEVQVLRRSTRPRKQPDRYAGKAEAILPLEPRSYKEAQKRSDFHEWLKGMQEEFAAIQNNETWELVRLPENRKAIGCKWVYKLKLDSEGKVQRYKARLVAKGFTQKFGEDYDEVFAPVVKPTVFRTLLTVASKRKMKVVHVDVKNAFLNGDLQNEIFMKQPEGFSVKGKEDHVYKLKRSLYGLKQSARCWNNKVNEVIQSLGFRRGNSDPCLYNKIEGGDETYILLYVDDMLIASRNELKIEKYIKAIESHFNITNLGEVKTYLGIQVEKDAQGVYSIHQKNYIKKMLAEYKMTDAKPSKIPMDPGFMKNVPENDIKLPSNTEYRKIIGSLLYLTVNSRPDIAVAVSILGRKVCEPKQSDLMEAKRILRFLVYTQDMTLKLGGADGNSNHLIAYVDADWAGDVETRRSTTGFIFKLGGGLISWGSRKQSNITLSSTEAEYVALSEACSEFKWIKMLLGDLNLGNVTATINEDNQSCISLANEFKLNPRTKHIEVKYHHVKELVDSKEICLKYCPTAEMIADVMTKPLDRVKLSYFQDLMGLK